MQEENGAAGAARDVTKVSWRAGADARRPDCSFLDVLVGVLTARSLPAEPLRDGEQPELSSVLETSLTLWLRMKVASRASASPPGGRRPPVWGGLSGQRERGVLTGLVWRLRVRLRRWWVAMAGTPPPRTGLARGLLLIGGRAGLFRGLRGARPDLAASSLARERRGLLLRLWGEAGASRSSRRCVSASFCWMAMRSSEFSVFFSSSAAASCLCISSS